MTRRRYHDHADEAPAAAPVEELPLFAAPAPPTPVTPIFDGVTVDPALDQERLARLLDRVRDFMADGQWRTLAQIKAECGGSEAGISARLRDLRKPQFGGHTVEHRRKGDPKDGLWEYRLVLRSTDSQVA